METRQGRKYMELPIEIQRIINDYAKPITRPDWKKGCYFCRMEYTELSQSSCSISELDPNNTNAH